MARVSLVVDQETFDSTNTTFEPVPEGEYRCTIYSIEDGKVQNGENKGKQRLNVQYKIMDGEVASDGTKQGNRRLFDGINTFPGVNRQTGAATVPFQWIALGKAMNITTVEELNNVDTDDWLGAELFVTVGHRDKMTKESGYKEAETKIVDGVKVTVKQENVKSIRSVTAGSTAATSTATVTGGKKTYVL